MCEIYTKIKTLNEPLKDQIRKITKGLEVFHQDHLLGAILFGSCAEGRANYRSDIDILLVFEIEKLEFNFVSKTRESIENFFDQNGSATALSIPLPVEFQVVRSNVFNTGEPEMLKNLKQGIVILDKKGLLSQKKKDIHE